MITNKKDVLHTKLASLDSHRNLCNSYLSVITDMIENIKKANEAMNHEIADIETYQSELEAVKNDMASEQTKNERILHNLNALIGTAE